MPKKIEGFQCEKCGEIYGTEDLANSCEQKHRSGFEFEYVFESNRPWPYLVKLVWTDEEGNKHTRDYSQ